MIEIVHAKLFGAMRSLVDARTGIPTFHFDILIKESGLELRELEAFYTTARSGSVTRAADLLNQSQATISKRLRNLEQRVGEPLFNRKTRPLSLTTLGERLLPSMGRLIRSMQDVQNVITGETTNEHLNVSDSYPLSDAFIPRAMQMCSLTEPAATFRFSFDSPANVAESVDEGSADFGIVHAPVLRPSLKITQIAEYDRVLITPKSHSILAQAELRIAELAKWPMIVGSTGSYSRALIERLFIDHGVKLNPKFEVDNNSTMKRFVSMGFGVAIVPRIVLDEADYTSVGVLSLSHFLPPAGIRLLQASSSPLSVASGEMVRQLTYVAKTVEAEAGTNRI